MSEKDFKLSFAVKKTNELSEEEIDQLIKLHNLTMKQDRTKKMFEEKYLFNFLGFSFHALMIYKNKIVGCNTVIPQEFDFFDKKFSKQTKQKRKQYKKWIDESKMEQKQNRNGTSMKQSQYKTETDGTWMQWKRNKNGTDKQKRNKDWKRIPKSKIESLRS